MASLAPHEGRSPDMTARFARVVDQSGKLYCNGPVLSALRTHLQPLNIPLASPSP